MLGIKPPVVADNTGRTRDPSGVTPWHAAPARISQRREAIPARMSREGDVDATPAPEATAEATPDESAEPPLPAITGGKSKWKPVKKPVEGN